MFYEHQPDCPEIQAIEMGDMLALDNEAPMPSVTLDPSLMPEDGAIHCCQQSNLWLASID